MRGPRPLIRSEPPVASPRCAPRRRRRRRRRRGDSPASSGGDGDDDDPKLGSAATSTPDGDAAGGTTAGAATRRRLQRHRRRTVDGRTGDDGRPASVPEVELPAETPTELAVTVITPGTASEAAEGDTVCVNYVGVRSEDGTQFDTNYGGGPFPVTLGSGRRDRRMGAGAPGHASRKRLQLDIPADLAYGDKPPGDADPAG